MYECISWLCPLGRIVSFILLQSTSLLYSCCQGYCGNLLAQDMGASQQGVLSVAPAVTDSSICLFWVVCEVGGLGGGEDGKVGPWPSIMGF